MHHSNLRFDGRPINLVVPRSHRPRGLHQVWRNYIGSDPKMSRRHVDYGPVSVQGDYLIGRVRVTHELDETATRLTVSVVLWPVNNSASITLPPRLITKSAPTILSRV